MKQLIGSILKKGIKIRKTLVLSIQHIRLKSFQASKGKFGFERLVTKINTHLIKMSQIYCRTLNVVQN